MSNEKLDRKSTRLNSSHLGISYAVFCLKKKNQPRTRAAVHVLIEETVLLTPGPLGLVHRDVSGAQQSVEVGAAVGVNGNPDTGTEGDVQAIDLTPHGHALNQLFCHLGRMLRVV